MIVLRTPKGWTGPAEVDGVAMEGTWRAHQVPLTEVRTNPDHLAELEALAAPVPSRGAVRLRRAANGRHRWRLAPRGDRRMGPVPHANGGVILRDLDLPDFRDYAVAVADRGRRSPRPPACSAAGCATSWRPASHPQLPADRPRRDGVQPTRTPCWR